MCATRRRLPNTACLDLQNTFDRNNLGWVKNFAAMVIEVLNESDGYQAKLLAVGSSEVDHPRREVLISRGILVEHRT
jgi:hypothetical protein